MKTAPKEDINYKRHAPSKPGWDNGGHDWSCNAAKALRKPHKLITVPRYFLAHNPSVHWSQ